MKNQPEEALVSHERKLFEYISVGLPSVFCHSHIYHELNELGPIGVSVDLKSSHEIAEALMSILCHSHKLDEMSENCLRLSDSSINWQKELDKMLAIYHT
ncbi:glycosyltransferase, partial [Umezakia ovalisporum]|uniref:glycosyltransferase n=1 Tax=Umezakia ovalisporum TaxID=75695 RepID=UPI0039C66C39